MPPTTGAEVNPLWEWNQNSSQISLQRNFDIPTTVTVVLICLLSLCVIVINCSILFISKFATGGHSPILIFVRSMCVADCFTALYGILKAIFISVQIDDVNCFIVESILFSSIISSVFTLLCLTVDSFVGLLYPLRYRSCIDKQFVILMMIILWNMAIVLGFSPLLGWNNEIPEINHHPSRNCDFFSYYTTTYLAFSAGIFCTSIVVILALQIKLHRVEQMGDWKYKLRPATVYRIKRVLTIVRLDFLTTTIFYLPFFVFLFVFCKESHCPFSTSQELGNRVYLFMIPWLLLKSVINAIIHASTSQFQQVVRDAKSRRSFRGLTRRDRDRNPSLEFLCRLASSYFVPSSFMENSNMDINRLPSNSTLQTALSTDSVVKRAEVIEGEARRSSKDLNANKKRARSIDYSMFAPVGPKIGPRHSLQVPHIKLPPLKPPPPCRHPHHLHETTCPMYRSKEEMNNLANNLAQTLTNNLANTLSGHNNLGYNHSPAHSIYTDDDFPQSIDDLANGNLNDIVEDSEGSTDKFNNCTALPFDGITPL